MFLSKKENFQIPFTPSYEHEHLENISVFWFERMFSQSSYGDNAAKGTNSCTLIALLTAEVIAREHIEIPLSYDHIARDVLRAFCVAVLEGNKTYGKLEAEQRLQFANLNIPEAMDAIRENVVSINEWFFVHVQIPTDESYLRTTTYKLTSVLRDALGLWELTNNHSKNYIFAVLIADNRSTLICFQKSSQTATYFDSHHHSADKGAVISQSTWKNLDHLIRWIIQVFLKMYKSKPLIFELSFLSVRT